MDHTVPIEPEDFLHGWQRWAARACDERALGAHLPELTTASWAPCCAGLHRPPHVKRIHRAQPALPGTAPSPLAPAAATRPQPLFLPWRVGRLWGPPSCLRHVGCPSFAGLASGARHRPGLPGALDGMSGWRP